VSSIEGIASCGKTLIFIVMIYTSLRVMISQRGNSKKLKNPQQKSSQVKKMSDIFIF
jgi:hypothetical protein